MTPRERVLQALSFKTPERIPKDLGGMLSTGISAFAYPKVVEALKLPPRLPRVHDTMQMLALPEPDVLDALGCDIVTICYGVTNAFDEPEKWLDYDFGGRLPARVRNPGAFRTQGDGTILQSELRMPPSSYVFDQEHGGQPLDFSDDLPKEDLRQLKRDLQASVLKDDEVAALTTLCQRVRESTDRAVFFNDMSVVPNISIAAHGGLGIFPILCLKEPDYVAELHGICLEHTIQNVRLLLPEIHPFIDILWTAGDDWGTQDNLIASPNMYRDLFKPYFRRLIDECHRIAPQVKTFLHSCGAIYDLIGLVIDSGFDILNPVQWSAGKNSFRDWKDKCRNRIVLWGGGVNSQSTLPLGTMEEIEKEVTEVVSYLSVDGGYVFCNIHNILAEIPPEKVITMYQAAEQAAQNTIGQ